MYNFTQAQVVELEQIANGSGPRPYSDFYARVAELIAQPDADGDAASPFVQAWFAGARDVNLGVGPWSDFIRDYTQAQIEIRTGNPLINPAALLNDASDSIAQAVLDDIVLSGGVLPSLRDIGNNDANATVAEIAAQVGIGADLAIWSGNILFPGLGDRSFFDQNIIGSPGNTYDLLSAAKASLESSGSLLGFGALFDIFSRYIGGSFDFGTVNGVYQSSLIFFELEYSGTLRWDDLALDNIILDQVGSNAATLQGTSSDEVLHGAGGNDRLISGGGDDVLDGGSGHDTADFSGVGSIMALFPADATDRNDGRITTGNVVSGSTTTLYDIEVIVGSTADDVFDLRSFSHAPDELDGGGGNDTLSIFFITDSGPGVSLDLQASSLSFAGGVIPPFLRGLGRRIYATIFSFWAGVIPPLPMFGRSWL